MNSDHKPKTKSSRSTSFVKIPKPQKWAWIGIFNPAEIHSPVGWRHTVFGSVCPWVSDWVVTRNPCFYSSFVLFAYWRFVCRNRRNHRSSIHSVLSFHSYRDKIAVKRFFETALFSLLRCSRQQNRGDRAKSSVNGQAQYAPSFTDTCRHHDDQVHLKYDDQVILNAGMRPYAEYHRNIQRRPMDVQHCDHVTSPTDAAVNGCAALTEVDRNGYR